jgi:hypothetical protein
MRKATKVLKLKRVVLAFADESRLTFEIDPRHWDFDLQKEMLRAPDGPLFKQYDALPSGSIKLSARYDKMQWRVGKAPKPKRAVKRK